MAPRHLNDRQKRRVRRKQAAHGVQDEVGEVVTRHGRHLAVQTAAGELIHCQLRRHIGEPVCGDRVSWIASSDGQGVVTSVLARDTELSRPNYSGRRKPLAANFSRMIIVIAPEPEPVNYLLDQYLVAAELIGVHALIVLNKFDLLRGEALPTFHQQFAGYEAIGYPLIGTSTKRAGGLDKLQDLLMGETSVLVGQSGVGKSSITGGLIPDRDIQIGRLSTATGLGRHTTSTTTRYQLPDGGSLIDSPGVRSFRLGALDRPTLEQGFREFNDYLGQCRFNDCAHGEEPGCALRAAAERGDIALQRLENFRHLLGNE